MGVSESQRKARARYAAAQTSDSSRGGPAGRRAALRPEEPQGRGARGTGVQTAAPTTASWRCHTTESALQSREGAAAWLPVTTEQRQNRSRKQRSGRRARGGSASKGTPLPTRIHPHRGAHFNSEDAVERKLHLNTTHITHTRTRVRAHTRAHTHAFPMQSRNFGDKSGADRYQDRPRGCPACDLRLPGEHKGVHKGGCLRPGSR